MRSDILDNDQWNPLRVVMLSDYEDEGRLIACYSLRGGIEIIAGWPEVDESERVILSVKQAKELAAHLRLLAKAARENANEFAAMRTTPQVSKRARLVKRFVAKREKDVRSGNKFMNRARSE